ncbi:hypothetical protein V6N12_029984 [Hibiscus sabdariffa]|uniref:Reverse transcriptase zinc-binding domain-containing protein n=1 Tax=Hibiscus sabdariffa TaxID=183260 RepID=A0ABR2A4V6_9ROSI
MAFMHKLGFLLITDTDALWDVWFPSLGPLSRYLLDPASASRNLTFANLTTEDWNWDVSSLSTLFDTEAIAHILSVKCPSLEDGDLANYLAVECSTTHSVNLLDCLLESMMTNAERFHRSISSSCFDCGNQLETSLHVLPDCHATRNLWLQILPGALIRPFFECDLHQWLSCNLAAAILHPHSSLPWNLVFASLTWQIWKRQNGLIFHNPDLSNDALIIRRNLAWVKHYSAWVARETGSNFDLRSVPLERFVPSPNWVILNVDGAIPMPMSNALMVCFGIVMGTRSWVSLRWLVIQTFCKRNFGHFLKGFRLLGHRDIRSLNFGSSYSSFTPEKLGYYCVLDTEIGQSPCGCFSKAC